MLCAAWPALPSCSRPVSSSITSAEIMLAVAGGRCSRVRSASFASVVATTVARKKSPPTSSARSLGSPSADDLLSSSAVCEAYEPSASTAGRPSARADGATSMGATDPNGTGPRHDLSMENASATSDGSRQYSPMSHSATRATRAEPMEPKLISNLAMIVSRKWGCVSTISRTKSTTSTAEVWLESPRKSISTGTTALAESGNLIAAPWMAVMSIARYSEFLSPSSPWVFCTSFLRSCITSPMLLGAIRSSVMSRVFWRMSRLSEERARRMSITISCSTFGCCLLRSCNRSSTISLMLLSL
mmetsp:Transcript_32711/g.73902  ORF Transcript_32711/g.73902 Transcript_32711/m.73902 type:complete len:301 (-) Transcript_32711:909-1811(-)